MKNPQVFPMVIPTAEPHTIVEGMTLRDYFAAAAMQAVITEAEGLREVAAEEGPVTRTAARMAYQMADAMLAERAKE